MAFCDQCGNSIDDGQRFCMNCGKPAALAPQPQAEAKAPTPTQPGQAPTNGAPPIPNQKAPNGTAAQPAAPSYTQPGFQASFQQAPPAQPRPASAPNAYAQRPPVQAPPMQAGGYNGGPARVVGIGGYLGALLLFQIPLAGLIIAICWACGATESRNKQNLARAMLIVWAISIAITLLIAVWLASVGASLLNDLLYDFSYMW